VDRALLALVEPEPLRRDLDERRIAEVAVAVGEGAKAALSAYEYLLPLM